jgi:hypothetical protein
MVAVCFGESKIETFPLTSILPSRINGFNPLQIKAANVSTMTSWVLYVSVCTAFASRLRSSVKLAEHFLHSVNHCLWLFQLNLVARSLDDSVYAARGGMR